MEEPPIKASIMASSQATSHDSFKIPSNAQEEPLRNSSNSNSQDQDSFVLVEAPPVSNTSNSVTSEISAKENENFEDLDSESYAFIGEEPASTDSDGGSDYEIRIDNENDTQSQRLTSFPADFRVMYIGQNVPNPCKHNVFTKISESLSQIFWEEISGVIPSDIGLEKRLVICPVSNLEDSKPQVDYFQDSGVAFCEADLTNVPYSKAFEYLQKTFAKTDDSNLVDLCVVFVPQNVNQFPKELLSTMKRLQEKVTLLPIITSSVTFSDERRAIVKLIEDNGIKIFVWKDDQMILDRNHNGEFNSKWVETVYTKKILTVDEFVAIDNQAIYEDLQGLRSRAIEIRKDRINKERARRRTQMFDKYVGTVRYLIYVSCVLGIIYLCVIGIWRYAEWSVISPELASSLQAVSRASLKSQNQNIPQTIPLDNGEIRPLIEVSQESSSRFTFHILNKKQYFENRKNDFEVIVTHNPPQILGRYDAHEIGNGRYVFNVNTTGSKGEVLVEIREKNGSTIKTVTWEQKDNKMNSNDIKEQNEEPTFLEIVKGKVSYAHQNAVSYSKYAYEEAKVFGTILLEELRRGIAYFDNQLVLFNDFFWDYVNYWVPIIRDKILNWTVIAEESIEVGYLNAKESIEEGYLTAKEFVEVAYSNTKENVKKGYLIAKEYFEKEYLRTKEESLNFMRFIKDQYEELYTYF